jgi:hypothetical protein
MRYSGQDCRRTSGSRGECDGRRRRRGGRRNRRARDHHQGRCRQRWRFCKRRCRGRQRQAQRTDHAIRGCMRRRRCLLGCFVSVANGREFGERRHRVQLRNDRTEGELHQQREKRQQPTGTGDVARAHDWAPPYRKNRHAQSPHDAVERFMRSYWRARCSFALSSGSTWIVMARCSICVRSAFSIRSQISCDSRTDIDPGTTR